MDANQRVYDRDAGAYQSVGLVPPEQRLLGLLRDRWHVIDMLDIGVGTGRTAYTFAPLVKQYLGIDYSAPMIALSRQRVPENDHVRFEVADARQLRQYGLKRFDLILFSFNGIDSVGHEDRLTILREIRACLKDDGLFVFSSHSLLAIPFAVTLPPLTVRQPLRSVYRRLRAWPAARRLASLNRQMDVPALQRQGSAVLRDDAHSFSLELYYVMPATQVAQLREVGFGVRSIYDLAGREVSLPQAPADAWLHYVCGRQ